MSASPDNLFPDDLPPARTREQQSMAVMGSSKDMTWPTPQAWFDYLDLEFGFTLDPCCVRETAKCDMFYTPETDGLAHAWTGHRVFMNPPYGTEIGRWMEKAYNECRQNGVLTVAFVPARVDTAWWHDYAAKASEVRFPCGRVTFHGASASAPFPVAIVVFRPRVDGEVHPNNVHSTNCSINERQP